MIFLKNIILVILLLLLFVVENQAVKFSSDLIKNIANYCYRRCYNENLDDDKICSNGVYTCELIEGTDDIYTITAIDFSKPGTPASGDYCYLENFLVFSNLTSIYAGDNSGKIRGNGEALLNVGKLTKIKKVFFKYVDGYDSNAVIPDSLEELYIGTSLATIPLYFFETGNSLKSLTIESGPLQKLGLPNLTLKNLRLGVTPSTFDSTISDSFSRNLVNLEYLELSYTTSGTTSTSSDPVFNYYKHLKTLKIKGGEYAQDFEFSSLHSDTKNSLESLTFTNSIIKLSNGYDFSNYLSGFKLTVNGYTTSFAPCTKCLKFPNDTTIESDGNLELDAIDFTGVSYFSSTNNEIYQALPELLDISTNYKQLKDFYLTDSEIYGTIPESYCQLPNDFSLSGNQFSKLPNCFKCDLTLESKLFPNGFYFAERDCSEYSLNQVTSASETISTKGGSISFSGTGLGWQYTFDSQIYELDIPNKEFTIIIPKGVGKNIQKQLQLNNYKNETVTYSYSAPQVTSHKVIEINSKSTLIFYGIGFDYSSLNIAKIIDIETQKSNTYFFDIQDENNDYITSTLDDVYSSISSNKSYQIIFTVGEQESKSYEFRIIKPSNNESDSGINSSSVSDSVNGSGSGSGNSSNSNNGIDSDSSSSDFTQTSSKLNILINLNTFIFLFILLL